MFVNMNAPDSEQTSIPRVSASYSGHQSLCPGQDSPAGLPNCQMESVTQMERQWVSDLEDSRILQTRVYQALEGFNPKP